MNNLETQKRDQRLANYLQHMQALRSEMVVAMDCIAGNDMAGFQQSVAQQEALCADLVGLAKTLDSQPMPSAARSWLHQADPLVASQASETSTALRQTNLEYAALLKHSGRSLALLSSLCRSHNGQLQEARGSRSKHQTWSCEM